MFPKKLTRQVICNPDEPVVETTAGRLRGLITEGTYLFRGVKYADAKRFRMPEKVKPWDGIKDAIVFGAACCEIATVIPHDAYNVPHFFYPQDEDCQYLNIWTQRTDKNAGRPVMVWIHGGGFSTGSSIELFAYDGEELSRHSDVVVVSLNHRLNVLGYLDLSACGDEYRYSGNLGMADIVAALEWIKENIAAFGGDPENVTVMGQSGGGMKVAALLQMPAADGLYHKAVIQSGISENNFSMPAAEAAKSAASILSELGIAKDNVKEIETIPYYKLARAADKICGPMGWGPVVDGSYFVGDPRTVGFRKENHGVPILIGTVFGEFSGNYNRVYVNSSKNNWDDAFVDKLMKEFYGDAAEKVAAAFKKAYPNHRPVDALFVDKFFRKPTLDYVRARANTAGAANVYSYLFTLEMPLNSGTVPWHNVEEAYMFHNAEYLEASYIPGVSEWLQDVMTGAWASFAETGDPNHIGMPFWEPVAADRASLMIFDKECFMTYEHDTELLGAIPDMPLNVGGSRQVKRTLGGGPRQSI